MRRNPLRPWLASCITAAGVGMAVPGSISAEESRGFMQVRASVSARTAVMVRGPDTLTITPEDLRRGSLTIAQPVQIKVFSNTRHGLELDVQAAAQLFTAVRVQGPGIDATLPGSGGTIAWRWDTRPSLLTPAALDLRFTFVLNTAATAGTQAWPVLVSGRALTQ
jgi:hypothetical protein